MNSLILLCCIVAISFPGRVSSFSGPTDGILVTPRDANGEDYLLLSFADAAKVEKRQTTIPSQHNISQIITPLTTGRWTASIDAQLQSSPALGPLVKCTMAICTAVNICGAQKAIGDSWATFKLNVQLRANEPQTISFVTTCSTPAYVALRNIVIPGSGAEAIVTAMRTATATPAPATETITMPASTAVSTLISTETEGASLGSAGSIILKNECPNSWVSMYGDEDFLHIPPGGLAIVPAKPMDRFGDNVQLLSHSQYYNNPFCVTSTREGQVGCQEPAPVRKRDGSQYPTHPRYISEKEVGIGDRAFEANNVLRLECLADTFDDSWLNDAPTANISITNTGCDGLTGWISWSSPFAYTQRSMAYAANTAASLLLPRSEQDSSAVLQLQTWSRNEPGWLDGTFLSIDGAPLENVAWTEYTLDGQPHTFDFVCNFTTRRPVDAMTQVIFSTVTTTAAAMTVTVEPTLEPINPYSVEYRFTSCEPGNVILASASNNPDFMVIDVDQYGLHGFIPVESRNFSLAFSPMNGRRLCTNHYNEEYTHCDWRGVAQTVPEYELLEFTCPDDQNFPVQPPDRRYVANVNLRIDAACPYIVKQIACGTNYDCILDAYSNTESPVTFEYPGLERLFMRAAGPGFSRAQWSVSSNPPAFGWPMSLIQERGRSVDITPPYAFSGTLDISVDCIAADEISVQATNDCPWPITLSKPDVSDWAPMPGLASLAFSLLASDPTAGFEPLNGQRICVSSERVTAEGCGYGKISISLENQDIIHVSCPDGQPPPLDTTGIIRPVEVTMLAVRKFLTVQIGCIEGSTCTATSLLESDDGTDFISLDYPVTDPRPRFRVKMFGADSPARMYYAKWYVSFSGGPQETYIQDNGKWLELTVPAGATSIELQGDAMYQPLDPSVETTTARYNVEVTNQCRYSNPVVIGTSKYPDTHLSFQEASLTMRIDPTDADVKFAQLTGGRLCVRADRSGYRNPFCPDTPQTVSIAPGERVLLFCPDNPTRPGDLTAANTVRFVTSGSCPYVVRQNWCYDWLMGPCEHSEYQGATDATFLWQNSQLRFKAVGEGWTIATLTVTGSDPAVRTYTQQRGDFVLIDVDMSIPGVEVTMECSSGQVT